LDVTFNESEENESGNLYEEDEDNDQDRKIDSSLENIEKGMLDNAPITFDGMSNGHKNETPSANIPPFYPRKQSLENPFDKFLNNVPQNIDYMHDNRSRRVSSVMSPYNIPSNPPQIHSPTTFRGIPANNANDFKTKNMVLINNASKSSEDNPIQKKLNEIIAASFNNWNNKPKRKETEDVDFSGGDNTLLGIMNSTNNNVQRKGSPFDFLGSNNILSPDYKPRTFSVNSGWSLQQQNYNDNRSKAGWEETPDVKGDQVFKFNNDSIRKFSNIQPDFKIQLNKTLKNDGDTKLNSIGRKNTLIDNIQNTLKHASPLNFPKFSAAFKPFKKRARSFHNTTNLDNIVNENESIDNVHIRKRDLKAEYKETAKNQV